MHAQQVTDPEQPRCSAGDPLGEVGGVLGGGVDDRVTETATVGVEPPVRLEAGRCRRNLAAAVTAGTGSMCCTTSRRPGHARIGSSHDIPTSGGYPVTISVATYPSPTRR
ncbi:hypothetical protein GCM10027610_025630 [Dactylosporangium cerinum]